MAGETTTSVLTNLLKASYSKAVDMSLWSEPMFRQFASVSFTDLTNPGSSVTKYIHSDLAVGSATTPLNEITDPTPVALTNPSGVSVTINEYGFLSVTTLRLRELSISKIDPAQAQIVARHLRNTMDALVSPYLYGGSNVVYSAVGVPDATGPTNTVSQAAGDIFSSKLVRYSVAKMRGRSALEFGDGTFVGLIHPDVSHDLRAETGVAAWRDPHVYGGGDDKIWKGEVGVYEGVKWIETPRGYSDTDGTSSSKVHRTVILGQEALAEVVAIEPGVTVSPQVDAFRRLVTLGWYGFLGWNRYREECIQRVESTSSIS